MKKTKFVVFILLTILLSTLMSISVKANSGPPANLSLTVTGLNESYSLDIFIYQETPLTQNQIDQTESLMDEDFIYRYYYQETYPEYLISFQDKDNYVSNSLYGGVNHFYSRGSGLDQEFVMFLIIPRIFKIVLINENDELIISEIITMKSYDFDITWNLEGVSFSNEITYDAGTLQGLLENPFYEPSYYIFMVLRLIVSILIEGLIFYAFGFRMKRTYLIFVITNLVSQIGLTMGTIYSYYRGDTSYGTLFIFIFGELLIFVGEMLLMTSIVREKKWYIRIFVVFLANMASLIIGLVITFSLINLIF